MKRFFSILIGAASVIFCVSTAVYARDMKTVQFGPVSFGVPNDYIVISDSLAYAVNPDYCDTVDDVFVYHDGGLVSDTGEELFNIYKEQFKEIGEAAFTKENGYQYGYINGVVDKAGFASRSTLSREKRMEEGELHFRCYFYFYRSQVYMVVFRSESDVSRLSEYEKTVVFEPDKVK